MRILFEELLWGLWFLALIVLGVLVIFPYMTLPFALPLDYWTTVLHSSL